MFRIALTNLGKYNEGTLDFVWLDMPATEEEIEDAKKQIGIGAPRPDGGVYEEWFITDYENDYDYSVGEYENLDELNEVADELEEEIGEEYADIYKTYRKEVDDDHDAAMRVIVGGEYYAFYVPLFGDRYFYLAEELGYTNQAGDEFVNYIDWEQYMKDKGYDVIYVGFIPDNNGCCEEYVAFWD